MEMLEIDPKLFVTCRLCLDNLGVYQIVPSVQNQIKFCYDIEVDPFDGLPQLICKACKSILSQYVETKNTYLEKQNTLKSRTEGKVTTSFSGDIQPEQETVSSTQHICKDNSKKKGFSTISTSTTSDSSDSDITVSLSQFKNKKKVNYVKRKVPSSPTWEINYNKSLICRFCLRPCKTKLGMKKHLNTHSSLMGKYNALISRHCSILLNKIDGKSNICNSNNIVVHNAEKFVHSENKFYFGLYTPKEIYPYTKSVITGTEKYSGNSESSDSDIVFKQYKKKRRRFISRSSIETVVVEKNGPKSPLRCEADELCSKLLNNTDDNNECINVDDSSDNASHKTSDSVNNKISADVSVSSRNAYYTIHNIISVCYKKYIKRIELCENEIPSHTICKYSSEMESLKHKVLSIGRKVINNQGFSCIGLLRFLEHHNLEIIWMPRLATNISKKTEYVRIMTKLRGNIHQFNDFDWEYLDDTSKNLARGQLVDSLNEAVQKLPENERIPNNVSMVNQVSNTNLSTDIQESTATNIFTDQAKLYVDKSGTEYDPLLKKILNKNPVAYPKQLPKKIKKQKTSTVLAQNKDSVDVNNEETDDILHMPIITSTVSLAAVPCDVKEKVYPERHGQSISSKSVSTTIVDPVAVPTTTNTGDKNDLISESIEASSINTPRIKVKPVSELMSDKVLSRMNAQQASPANIVNSAKMVYITKASAEQQLENGKPAIFLYPSLQCASSSISNAVTTTVTEKMNQEYVIMDTVDMPCTQTNSPYHYFKNLLQIHNVILLDSTESMPLDHICLLKFKLMFQQESNFPVVLCLALYCAKRHFCLKVRDTNEKDIDINRLSANWQWEILKVYKGDVVNKLLENAQKVSREVHNHTNLFLHLLKSIKFQSVI